MHRLAQLFGRVKHILRTEGLLSLLRQGFAFLAGCIFRYETYYLVERRLEEMNGADFMPRIEDFTFRIVSTTQEADELVANGFEFRSSDGVRRERLDRGAIALCVFIGRELAYMGWIAMNEEAQRSISDIPLQVDFSKSEAFSGGVWTNPKYRGRGLHPYGVSKRIQFLRGRGIIVSRRVIDKKNISAQRISVKIDHTIYAEARYLKLLWWKSWKETPTNQISH